MSKVIQRWVNANKDDAGHYAAYVGFEKEINSSVADLDMAYDRLELQEKVSLFCFVIGLLKEESKKKQEKSIYQRIVDRISHLPE